MKVKKNPYASKKKAVGINLSGEVIDYFKKLSAETGLLYQTLIDLYLKDCVKSKRKIKLDWEGWQSRPIRIGPCFLAWKERLQTLWAQPPTNYFHQTGNPAFLTAYVKS